jgi:hypothetical protein
MHFPEFLWAGYYLTGLSQDDAGGLRYILSTNNVNIEALLPGMHAPGTNAGAFVDLAPRPGINKITFMRQQYDNSVGQFMPITNRFTDHYFTNGILAQQQLERVTAQPDFLFCVADTGATIPSAPPYVRTGTSNWWSSTAVTGGAALGPGVIRPPVRITFNRLGLSAQTDDGGYFASQDYLWGSFDASTNPPIAYPCATFLQTNNQLSVHLWLRSFSEDAKKAATWSVPVSTGGGVLLQTSTNLTDWVSLVTVTNHGGAVTWDHWYSQSQRFFRVVPQ